MNINSEVEDFKNNEFKQNCKNYTFVPFIYEKVDRIVVLGDIHGDYKMAIKLLIMSKVAEIISEKTIQRIKTKKIKKSSKKSSKQSSKKSNKQIKQKRLSITESNEITEITSSISDVEKEYKLKWIGGKTHVVQVGDQIDRCRPNGSKTCDNPLTLRSSEDEDSDTKILKLFTDLHEQAVEHGGAVISLLGNHELLNALGEVQYVSFKGLNKFMKKYKVNGLDFEDPIEARKHAFQPGNEYGKFLGCTRNATVVIGSNLFVHAGIVDALARELQLHSYMDVENINIIIKKWLLGLIQTNQVNNLVRSQDSMFWSRILGSIPNNMPMSYEDCKDNITEVLKIFKIDKMIIGHTPQSFMFSKDINGTCGNKIWRVDNGSSKAFDTFDKHMKTYGERHHNRRYQYLEILNDNEYHVYDENGKVF
jgi:hypothetical protein